MTKYIPSQLDVEHLEVIRRNVVDFMKHCAFLYAQLPGKLLDIAPQVHEGARPFFPSHVQIETLDLDPLSDCTYVGDITKHNNFLSDETFQYIVCTEVLEHTLQPFNAITEIWRLLRPNGFLFLSVPFNFRIHGPLPDCWRFTEHGLRALMVNKFDIIELNGIETKDRPLMPVHYTVVARKILPPLES